MKKQLLSDRRQERRLLIPVELIIYGKSDIGQDAFYKTKIHNISHEGIAFRLQLPLDPQKKYHAEIELIPNKKFQSQLKVLWVKEESPKSFLIGAELNYFSENQMNVLARFFEESNRKSNARSSERRYEQRRNILKKFRNNKRVVDRRLIERYYNVNKQNSKRHRKTLEMKRVVITGLGVVSPNGIGGKEFLQGIRDSRLGISVIEKFNPDVFPSRYGGTIDDQKLWNYIESELCNNETIKLSSLKAKMIKRSDRPVQFAMAAALGALEDSKIDLRKMNKKNFGISVGSSMGGLGFAFKEHDKYFGKGMNRMNPYTIAAASPNPCSGELAAELGLRGPSATFSQGCTSGANAISYAYQQIQRGSVALMLAGGTDSPFQESTYAAFCRSGMLAPSPNGVPPLSRPMDKDRTGIVLAEGAALVLLEEYEHALARGAKIYGEIIGDSNTCDGYDMVKWRWHGSEAARAIKEALDSSGISERDISLVFAQAPGSHDGDNMELRAISKVFGKYSQKVPIANVKGLIGYAQAACAAIEIVSACLALKHNFIPGSPNFSASEVPLNISQKIRYRKLSNVLINCFGFGGKNICLVLQKNETQK